MIVGAHTIIYSADAEADRAFLRDVLRLPSVDVGDGWLIFGLPPAEVAMHPGDENDVHELFLMCDDVKAFIAEMKSTASPAVRCRARVGACCATAAGRRKLGVYEPRRAAGVDERGHRSTKRGVRQKPRPGAAVPATGSRSDAVPGSGAFRPPRDPRRPGPRELRGTGSGSASSSSPARGSSRPGSVRKGGRSPTSSTSRGTSPRARRCSRRTRSSRPSSRAARSSSATSPTSSRPTS